ncbi:TetR/AcrR family transcriptional regulator C-terminal domain-containing protein, partial [Escherichia coli]|nr:TetR/AcrR family transcriptional regulator C-terminal domain-containing protein [Escherichia coli]
MLPAVRKIDDASTGRARIAHLVMTEGSRFPVIAQAYLREIHQPLQQAMTQLIQEAASAGELKAEQ